MSKFLKRILGFPLLSVKYNSRKKESWLRNIKARGMPYDF